MMRYFAIALAVLVLDQISKKIILVTIGYRQAVEVFFWLDIVHIYNRGAAFSFLASAAWANIFLLAVGIIAILFFSFWLWKWGPKERWHDRLAIALVLGGAGGNIADRLQFGYVIDFISVHYKNWYYPSFNIADSAISIGVALILLGFFLHKKNISQSKTSPEDVS